MLAKHVDDRLWLTHLRSRSHKEQPPGLGTGSRRTNIFVSHGT